MTMKNTPQYRLEVALKDYQDMQYSDGPAHFTPRPNDVRSVLKQNADLLAALRCLWSSCIPDDQNVVGRIHLKEAETIIKEMGGFDGR